jgi:hypothetical protein
VTSAVTGRHSNQLNYRANANELHERHALELLALLRRTYEAPAALQLLFYSVRTHEAPAALQLLVLLRRIHEAPAALEASRPNLRPILVGSDQVRT